MANKEDFLAKESEIKAIQMDAVLTPSIPVDVFVQEADTLYKWASEDVLQLATVGITQELLDDLPVRSGACREAQSLWIMESRSADEWKQLAPSAYELRDDLLAGFKYAFRDQSSLLSRVKEINEGTGDEDMIQDLNDLAVLGLNNLRYLTVIGIDETKLNEAVTVSEQLADLLALLNGEKLTGNEVKIVRDQAYTYLKQLVDQIKTAGKYVFRKDKIRLKGYASSYWRKRYHSNANSELEQLNTAE